MAVKVESFEKNDHQKAVWVVPLSGWWKTSGWKEEYPYNELSVKGLAVSETASSQGFFFCGRKLVRYQKFTFSKQNEDIAD